MITTRQRRSNAKRTPRHYDEVFGKFNAQPANKLLSFLVEATWGGFHDQKARLKTAILVKGKAGNRRIVVALRDQI